MIFDLLYPNSNIYKDKSRLVSSQVLGKSCNMKMYCVLKGFYIITEQIVLRQATLFRNVI